MRKRQPLFRKKVSLIIRISERCIETQRKRVTKCEYIFYCDSVVSYGTIPRCGCRRCQLGPVSPDSGSSQHPWGGPWAATVSCPCGLNQRSSNVHQHHLLYFGSLHSYRQRRPLWHPTLRCTPNNKQQEQRCEGRTPSRPCGHAVLQVGVSAVVGLSWVPAL